MNPLQQNYKRVNIMGVNVYAITLDQLLKEISSALKAKRGLSYGAVDPNKLNLAYRKEDFRQLYRSFDIVGPDATGTLLAAKLLGKQLGGERISGDILARRLYTLARAEEMRFYFLGSEEGKAKKTKNNLLVEYPWLDIVGVHHGYFNNEGRKNDEVVRDIKKNEADIVFVGMGSPKQEDWIVRNQTRLEDKVLITMGGYFDMAAKNPSCYPDWVYRYKLNWIYRILQEPARLGPRYLVGLPLFFARVLRQCFRRTIEN